MRGVLVLFLCVVVVFAEESWWTTFHQMSQRSELEKQNQLKQRSVNIKERMNYNLQQVVVELQLLNANLAKVMAQFMTPPPMKE